VVTALRAAGIELVVLAGFDRLLSPVLIGAFPGRIMNIHPALLPAVKGLHAQRQALEYGVKIAGATVHFVDEHLDHGPIIIQGAVPLGPDETEDTIRDRILQVEHDIYPTAISCLRAARWWPTGAGRRPTARRLGSFNGDSPRPCFLLRPHR
jgi:phosphoribosylglycinamide formyltransferase-1